MTIINFFKKLLCLNCYSASKADVSFISSNKQSEESTSFNLKEKDSNFILEANSHTKIKPLHSQDIFNFTESEIELDDENSDITEYFYEPLPNINCSTLVLDLDNTLIYASTKEIERFDHEITVYYKNKPKKVWIVERPGLREFLESMSQYFEIVLFTAGIRQYGIKVMKKIDPNFRIKYFLDRRFCTRFKKNSKNQELFAKNISILGRDERKVLLVDDREYSFVFNTESGILISSFDGDMKDKELQKLSKFLIECSKLDDMRERPRYKI